MKIAAGEVIERPASVVKELIENSIDAGATNIRVEIKNGGLSYLRVSDDGGGIPFDEVPLAFERHATSKIRAAEDLFDLHTLGFRGEALPSIAAVSQLTLLTRPRRNEKDGEAEEAGSEIAFEGGRQLYHRPAGSPPGTVITVRNLFFNLPARQKWSRSGSSEAGHILTILNNYALAYPQLKFSLVSEGRLLLQTSGNGELREAVGRIYGSQAAAAMLPVESHPAQVDADGVITEAEGDGSIRVRGLTAGPDYSKPNRNFLLFFVNRRWVISRTLAYAVQEAYHSLLQTGRYPVCVLTVEIDPAQVDANVHPAKTEVRFLKERQVFGAVQQAVREALVASAGGAVWEAPNPRLFVSPTARLLNNIYAPPEPEQAQQSSLHFAPLEAEPPEADLMLDEVNYARPDSPLPAATETETGQAEAKASTEPELPVAPATPMKARLPLLRVLGQMSNTYMVAEGPDGMYLIDQHAAHERILYERFRVRLTDRELDRQLLLDPLLLDLTPQQRLRLGEATRREELAALGFTIEPGEEGAFWLKAVPGTLLGRDVRLSLTEMLDEAEGVRDGGCHPEGGLTLEVEVPRSWLDRLAASLACHSAVRAGQVLSLEEMRELIGGLERTASPNACAHGRPTMIHLSQGQLEKGFGRK